jgi:hypothetical protein
MKKTLFILAAGLMVSAIMFGCSTEKPWEANPLKPLELLMVSAPDTNTVIPTGSNVSFFWAVKGGTGDYTGFQWYLNPPASTWGDTVEANSATYENLQVTSGNSTDYTFYVRVIDSDGAMVIDSVMFTVSLTDQSAPTIAITQSPIAGSFVATGTTIRFAWAGDDGSGNSDMVTYQYIYTPTSDTSTWISATTAAFSGADVPATDPAWFYVRARDSFDNMSPWDSVSFIIKDASILYVDDYQWLDANGNPDMPKEREQKQFYRDVLEGYAFAEWDIAVQGMMDSATVLNFSSIVFASDSYLGDASGTWWYDVGDVGGGVMKYYMENGGHLLAAGANILQWIYNSNPPAAGDFEFDWFGIDSTLGWDYWDDFTWAVSAGNFAALPDSMKIDVAKNGDQIDIAEDIFAFRDSTVILYVKGLDIDGLEPHDYGESVGHIFYISGEARSAMLNFDAFSMPQEGIRQTFQIVLGEFGE